MRCACGGVDREADLGSHLYVGGLEFNLRHLLGPVRDRVFDLALLS